MGSWVKFYLQGTMSNRDAIGSLVQVNFSDGSSQIRQYSGSGYQSQSLAVFILVLLKIYQFLVLILNGLTGLRNLIMI